MRSVIFDDKQFSAGDVIVTGFARDEYAFEIIDHVLSLEEGTHFLYENLENMNYNYHYNASEVTRTSIFHYVNQVSYLIITRLAYIG